jgi:hypothetical protein
MHRENEVNNWETEKPFPWFDSGLAFLLAAIVILLVV